MKPLQFRTSATISAFCLSALLPATAAFGDYLEDEELFEEDFDSSITVSDPFESFNRAIFEVNDFVYMSLVQPVANTYEDVTPEPVAEAASNFFDNLKYPVRLAGNLLQGKVEEAAVETGRFAVNSTVGFFGLFRPSDDFEALQPVPDEDIGQALASWGVGEGPYLVLPLFGPSNLRDLGGMIGDRAVNPLEEPFSVTEDNLSWETEAALSVTGFISASPSLMDRYIQLKGSAIDPYSALKNGYTQFRRMQIEE